MDVLLLSNVRNLGSLGERVKVKAGFARNFLVPQGKAVPATAENVKVFEERRAELEAKVQAELESANVRVAKLAELASVTVAAKSGDEGKLFGSIGTRDIAQAITAAGVEVKKAEILMPAGPIRHVGDYTIELQLHSEVRGEIKVSVVAE